MGNSASSGDLDAVHDDLAGDRRAERQLAADLRRGQTFHALFENEAADGVVVRGRFRPDHEHVRDRRIGDPRLCAGEPVAAVDLFGACRHAAGVGAGIRLRQAEAADRIRRDASFGRYFLRCSSVP